MSLIASQITSLTIVYSTVYLGADQRKHQSSASLAFVRGIHRGPVNSPHKWPVTRKMFPFDDVIMVASTAKCPSISRCSIISRHSADYNSIWLLDIILCVIITHVLPRLLRERWGNRLTAPVPVKDPWILSIWKKYIEKMNCISGAILVIGSWLSNCIIKKWWGVITHPRLTSMAVYQKIRAWMGKYIPDKHGCDYLCIS